MKSVSRSHMTIVAAAKSVWQIAEVTEVKSEGGTTLAKQPDGEA